MDEGFVQFKQERPFYDMVASFMVSLASCPAIFNADNPMGLREDHYTVIEGTLVPGRHFRPLDVFQQVQGRHFTMDRYLITCCCMVVNSAYEAVKDKNDHSEEFEFFRHLRNASSHRNQFHFTDREPHRPARWRGLVLDSTLKGDMNPLQGQKCFGNKVGIADVIDLLVDIERRIDA